MKRSKLINILLLLSLNFSIVHAYAIEWIGDAHSHCDATHFTKEFSQPLPEHGDEKDLCANHYIFHVPYIPAEEVLLPVVLLRSDIPVYAPAFPPVSISQTFLKPPIA